MHNLLSKWLEKHKVDNPEKLDNSRMLDGSPNERQTFKIYNEILSKPELTLEDVKKFCQTQVEIIEGKWKNLDLENMKKAEMIPYHTVYRTLLTAIDSPRSARESLEKQLNELLK